MTPLPPQPPARPSAGAAASHGASNTTPAATANVRATTVPLLVPQGLPSAYNRAPLPLPSTSVRVGGCAATAAAVNSAAAAVALPPPPQPLRFPPPSASLEAHVHASLPSPQGGGSSCTVAGASTVAVAPWLPLPAHPSPNDMWTPEVFRNRRLRSGKWIREEEIYAEALIDLFEKGLASDCTSGCTLRAYLSKKLHCAPMRISKKYAGKGIGKLAFVPQATVAGAEPSGSEAATATTSSTDKDDAVKRQEAQVQKKAEAFYLAVFQCNEYLGVPLGFLFGPAAAAAVPPPAAVPYTSVATVPAQAVVPPPLLFGATAPAPVPTLALATSGPSTSLSPVVSHGAVLPPTQHHHHSTLRLQQTYLNALHQQQQHSSTSPAPLLLLPPQPQSNPVLQSHGMPGATALPTWGAPAPPQTVASAPASSPSVLAPQGSAPPSAAPAPAPVDPLRDLASTHQAPDFLTGFDRVALSLKPASGGTGSDALPVADGAADHHPHRMLPPSLPQADASSSMLHCSPTFTSRSFDDFHRFLGQDLVSLDASPFHKTQHQRNHSSGAVSIVHTNGVSSAPAFPVHDLNGSHHPSQTAPPASATSTATAQQQQPLSVRGDPSESRALFSTESYAVFASAAVAASSQHAAYLNAPGLLGAPPPGLLGSVPHGQGNPHPSTPHGSGVASTGARGRSDTFDVETTMNLVSAHLQPSRQQQQQERRASHDSRGAAAPKTRTYHCNSVTFPKTRESLLERMYGPRLSNLVSGSEPSTTSSSGAENESGQEGGGSAPSSSASSTGAASESDDVHTDHSHSEEQSSDSDHTGDFECDESSTLPKKHPNQQQHHHVPKCKKAKTSSSCPEAGAVEQTYGV